MDIRQIQYFIRVYEERNFSKAAEKANVVQPALSMQIRRLEEELSTTLFDRSSRGIEPTATGRRLYELCVPIVRNLSQARQEIIELAQGNGISGAIRVGTPPSVNRGVLAQVLALYAERFPNVEVNVTEAYSNTLTAMVQDGQLDFALGGRPQEGSGLDHRAAFEDRLLLVAGSPVNGETLTPCRLTQMQQLKLILPSRQNLLGTTIFDYIASGEIVPHRVIKIDGVVATLELARNSDWAAIFPVVAMAKDVARSGLYLYPIIAPTMRFGLHLVHDPRRPLSAANRAFIEILEAELHSVDALRARLFVEPAG
jgi:DNA-binding transcriptional LysR family regulator